MTRQELQELSKNYPTIMKEIGSTGAGKELVKFLSEIAAKQPCFSEDAYKTAHNLGRLDYINKLIRDLTAT